MPWTRRAETAFRRIVGPEGLEVSAESLLAAETATFATRQRIVAILRPGSVGEVQRCVRVANDHRIPLHPISRGRNWGYGSRVPARTGCALLDLRRLDRIVDYDARLAYVTIEPGVTFGQLFAFVRRKLPGLLPPAIPIESGSVIGNTLERGLPSFFGGMVDVCNLEVVLPQGDRVETGFGRVDGSRVAKLHRTGVGPHVDGLFAQSNLGVVTRMTLWLRAKMRYAQYALVGVEKAGLGGLIDAAQQLILRGVVPEITLNNASRVLALTQQFPWGAVPEPPIPQELLETLCRRSSLPAWTGSAIMQADSLEEIHLKGKAVRAALRGRSRVRFGRQPDWDKLSVPYWRKRMPVPKDPDLERDHVGMLFAAPAIPFRGADVARAATLTERAMREHGFDPILALRATNGPRSLVLLAFIAWDRDVRADDRRALRCYAALTGRLAAAGYHSYRDVGPASVKRPRTSRSHRDMIRAIKGALDPRAILSPGRYEY